MFYYLSENVEELGARKLLGNTLITGMTHDFAQYVETRRIFYKKLQKA